MKVGWMLTLGNLIQQEKHSRGRQLMAEISGQAICRAQVVHKYFEYWKYFPCLIYNNHRARGCCAEWAPEMAQVDVIIAGC